ncbi:MAG: AraC family transcriptional regulator [Eubacteriales bacterium]|nr:AraC family transcriptional regulator [Eubacteriales bacterium]
MIPYVSFKGSDQSAIAVEVFQTMDSVPSHRHDFQEFVLITKGSCVHRYKDLAMPLIPGDVFLVPPHQEHAYVVENPVSMYNCQFYPPQIADWWQGQFGDLLSDLFGSESGNPIFAADLNRQNIIHLSVPDAIKIQQWLETMLEEQQEQQFAWQQVKQECLNLILITIVRARQRQFATVRPEANPRRELVALIQRYLEENLTEHIDFQALARQHNISPSHFRAVFKAITGLPPVEYLNRLRMVRAIEYLKSDALPTGEICMAVGIEDANYFSRLFRKIIGYSPREFRNLVRN